MIHCLLMKRNRCLLPSCCFTNYHTTSLIHFVFHFKHHLSISTSIEAELTKIIDFKERRKARFFDTSEDLTLFRETEQFLSPMVAKVDIEKYCNQYEELFSLIRCLERRAYSDEVGEKVKQKIESIPSEIKDLNKCKSSCSQLT